jgi:hypothetical protein
MAGPDFSLAKSAAAMGTGKSREPSGGDLGELGAELDEGTDEKSMFLQMCQAIRDGDDEAAWEAWQACRE